jgi:hypothetical protein
VAGSPLMTLRCGKYSSMKSLPHSFGFPGIGCQFSVFSFQFDLCEQTTMDRDHRGDSLLLEFVLGMLTSEIGSIFTEKDRRSSLLLQVYYEGERWIRASEIGTCDNKEFPESHRSRSDPVTHGRTISLARMHSPFCLTVPGSDSLVR